MLVNSLTRKFEGDIDILNACKLNINGSFKNELWSFSSFINMLNAAQDTGIPIRGECIAILLYKLGLYADLAL